MILKHPNSIEHLGPLDAREDHFYGRRKGRPVRPQKRKLLETVLPKISLDLEAVEDRSYTDPKLFFEKEPQEIWLEIGFGGGEHLAHLAAQNPDIGFIGSEVFINGVASFLEHHEEKQLSNVRLFPDDVRLLLKKLPPQTLSKIFILFPDPWPKARHNKRRLVQQETLTHLETLLVPGGTLRLASDHDDYIAWMAEEIEKVPSLTLVRRDTYASQDDKPFSWPSTRYEEKALENGLSCTSFLLQKPER